MHRFGKALNVGSMFEDCIHSRHAKRFNPSPTLPLQGKGVVKLGIYRQKLVKIIQIAENQSPSITREGLGEG
ncbi:MAG: hypothetical protein AAGJ18_15685 [Bacteroidota bacterium]